MAYRFKLKEPLANGVRRIGVEQIDRAIAELRDNRDIAASVHNARRCFKRLRALTDLVRPALDKKLYRGEDRRFRDLGRLLSGARDIQVMRESVDALSERQRGAGDNSVAGPLRAWLDARRHEAESHAQTTQIGEAITRLEEAREAFSRLPVEERGFATIGDGFTRTYREGRRRFALAFNDGSDEAFHNCRKMVQRHWRHLQLLSPAWPEIMGPRIALASELSQLIGEDHDLAVLADYVQAYRAILGGQAAVSGFIDQCRARQDEIRAATGARGQRLYAAPPKAFMQTLESYWGSARAIERTRAYLSDAPAAQNVIPIASRNGG